MSLGITHPRIRARHAIALAHSTSFSAAASTSGKLFFAEAMDIEIDRNPKYVDPQGTTGTEFKKATHFEAAIAPRAAVKLYCGNRQTLALLLEHATHGAPKALQASSDISIAGDGGNIISMLVLNGIRPGVHTDSANIIYAKFQSQTLSLYSDSARTLLIAQASGSGAQTLSEQNSSGLSGTVTLALSGATEAAITLTIARVRPQRSAQIANYFTLFRDTGANGELETLTGCTIASMHLRSSEAGPLEIDLDIVAGNFTTGSHDANVVPAITTADNQFFQHAKCAVTWNGNDEVVFGISHGIIHMAEQPLANAATPITIYKTGSDLFPIVMSERLDDESVAIIADGRAGNWESIVVDYSYGSKHLIWTYDQVKPLHPDLAPFRGEHWEDVRHHFIAREAVGATPNDPVTITLDL